MTCSERLASTCLPCSAMAHVEGALALRQRLEDVGAGVRGARHAGDLAEGQDRARGAIVEQAALADDVAEGGQALLQQSHGGPAGAGPDVQRRDVDPHGLGHELWRRRRGEVGGLDLDAAGRRGLEGDERVARLAGRRHQQVDVDRAQLVAVAVEAHRRRLARDPRLHDEAHPPRLSRQRDAVGRVAAHPLGRQRQQRPRCRRGGARRGHEKEEQEQTAPFAHGAEMYLGSQTASSWRALRPG